MHYPSQPQCVIVVLLEGAWCEGENGAVTEDGEARSSTQQTTGSRQEAQESCSHFYQELQGARY